MAGAKPAAPCTCRDEIDRAIRRGGDRAVLRGRGRNEPPGEDGGAEHRVGTLAPRSADVARSGTRGMGQGPPGTPTAPSDLPFALRPAGLSEIPRRPAVVDAGTVAGTPWSVVRFATRPAHAGQERRGAAISLHLILMRSRSTPTPWLTGPGSARLRRPSRAGWPGSARCSAARSAPTEPVVPRTWRFRGRGAPGNDPLRAEKPRPAQITADFDWGRAAGDRCLVRSARINQPARAGSGRRRDLQPFCCRLRFADGRRGSPRRHPEAAEQGLARLPVPIFPFTSHGPSNRKALLVTVWRRITVSVG